LVLILLCLFGFLKAQRFSFVNYNTAQGLPQSQVTALSQDEKGALWVGTLGGLARFNGKEFLGYTNENGLLNNRITCLYASGSKIWVGHEGGVSCIQGKKIIKWSFGKTLRSVSVSDILPFGNKLLIATNGEGLFKLESGKLVRINFSITPLYVTDDERTLALNTANEDLQKIRDLHVEGKKLYLGTRAGVLVTDDLRKFNVLPILDGLSVSSIQSNGKHLYVTTFKNGLYRHEISSSDVSRIQAIDTLFSLRKCLLDKKGDLWVVATEGVFRLHKDRLMLSLDQKRGLPMESIRCIWEDQSGVLWLGSEGKGLLRFPGEQFTHFGIQEGMSSDLVISATQLTDGGFWLGTFDKGAMRFYPQGKILKEEFENSATVWSILTKTSNSDWFGTENGLVRMSLNGQKKIYYAEDGLAGDKVAALYKISSNTFYIGGSEGVSYFSGGKFHQLLMPEPATVRNFCKSGGKVFCVADNGFYEVKGNRLIRIADFTRAAYSLVVDEKQRIWIGTEEGLFLYQNGLISRCNFASSAASNFVNFLVMSERGLYIGTNNGLYLIRDLDHPKRGLLHLGIADGLNELETNLNSGYEDRQGNLWFGTASGFVKFNPKKNVETAYSPSLLVKGILVNYQSDIEKYGISFNNGGIPASLELPYFKNNLTIELDGIDLDNYAGLQFQFWMEGLDQNWSPLSKNAILSFNGLPAGDYVLHARCVDAKGRISDEWVFPVAVGQAFYRTWWFIFLCTLSVGCIIWYGLRTRLRREQEKNEKEMLEYKSRLLNLEQQSLNASMNRHFIFNSLNSIQYFINTQDRISANRYLTNFARLIRKNLDSSDEGNLVSLQQELERVELYLSLESMRFNDRFDYVISVDEEIDSESLIIPAMMIQPFIENSIIHGILPNEGVKGYIDLRISLKGNNLLITIRDNGVGVLESLEKKADFSGDHESKGTEITLKRIQLLRKLTKKDFELIGPRQIFSDGGQSSGTEVILKIFVDNLD
jgi:ligand-binding sensor domain-containing protein/two-component sensor histidine kinase